MRWIEASGLVAEMISEIRYHAWLAMIMTYGKVELCDWESEQLEIKTIYSTYDESMAPGVMFAEGAAIP